MEENEERERERERERGGDLRNAVLIILAAVVRLALKKIFP